MPSFGDRFRRFFAGQSDPAVAALDEFLRTHKGVEGYIEPRTATNPTSLLLVDRDGDHARAPVREPRDAARWCERHGVPVYDASVIGYPKRMKDFERRRGTAGRAEDLDARFEELERRFKESGPETPDD